MINARKDRGNPIKEVLATSQKSNTQAAPKSL